MRVRDPLLGTRCEVEVRAGSADVTDAAQDRVFAEVERLESVFTVFDESSQLHQLRRSGSTKSSELVEVRKLARSWHDKTGGAFHPALQPLVNLWARSAEAGSPPDTATLTEVVGSLNPDDHAHLDFNALAKGWIADRGLDAAFTGDDSVHDAWLSLGGDLVHRGDGSVVVGIEDPARPYDNVDPLATIDVANEALATSGTVHRFWIIGGCRYSRVLDPRSGQPVDHIRQATVVAPTAATADVLATVALVLEPDQTLELVASEGAECLLISASGETTQTSDRFRPM